MKGCKGLAEQAAWVAMAWMLAAQASAATITVNSLADEPVPGRDVCQLRQAIEAANTNTAVGGCAAGAGADVIEFRVTGTIALTSKLPTVVDELTISGPGAERLSISGSGRYQVIEFAPLSITNTMENLTINGGFAPLGAGCITHDAQSLTLRDLVIGNCTTEISGGAILISSGAVTPGRTTVIERCVFSGNRAGSYGGAIFHANFWQNVNDSLLTIRDSTFVTNHAESGGGAINSGANDLDTVTIERSTFSQNSSAADGSAIRVAGYQNNSALVVIKHSTISANTADSDASGSGSAAITMIGGSLEIQNTILAGNLDLGGTVPQPDLTLAASATVNSLGHNLLGDNRNVTTEFPEGYPNGNDDYVGSSASPIDPLLSILANNGGPTPTMLPESGSPVIDLGSCPGETADQRGLSNPNTGFRPIDMGPDNADDGCDIGAVEYYSPDIFADSFEGA